MGPALPTSRQLDAFRRSFGSGAASRTTWMSATVTPAPLVTVDNPEVTTTIGLGDGDRTVPLARRLDADKVVRRLDLGPVAPKPKEYPARLAAEVRHRHRPGTRTLIMVNMVERAAEVHDRLRRALHAGAGAAARPTPAAAIGGRDGAGGDAVRGVGRTEDDRGRATPEVVLVHSRFRPGDRRAVVERAIAPVDPDGPGTIVVSTQVLEAGVDVSARLLVTELAPWPSIVQRAGRCNRAGDDDDAELWWVEPPKALPYDEGDLEQARQAIEGLEGGSARPAVLHGLEVNVSEPLHPVLRRRDLLDLFDTLPDLSGNDVDVSRFIRDADDVDVQVAWRPLGGRPRRTRRRCPGGTSAAPSPSAS